MDLKRQYLEIKKEIDAAVSRVMRSQSFILGEEVANFEKRIADYCGVKYAIGVASGTDALLISLRALDIERGDKVITTPFTFFATAGAIHNVGATPVFADIEPGTFNIDPSKTHEILERDPTKIKAIMPVHLYGQTADMKPIMKIAQDYGLAVIEDAAQALGAEYRAKKAGTLGDTGCFSFFPSKNLGGAGDGGMIVTNDQDLAEKIRVLRVHGSKPKYYHHVVGYNSRLDALQAAILNTKLDYIDQWGDKRRENAEYYTNNIKQEAIQLPIAKNRSKHVYNQYTIRTATRDELMRFLTKSGIGSTIYYPLSLHLQPCFAYLGYKKGDFPIAEKASNEVLSLPIFPELRQEEKDYLLKEVNKFSN